MKTRILASIITAVLTTSAAQAETAFTTRDLEVIYSGMNPSWTRDVDVHAFYPGPPELLLAAEEKSTCHWRVVKGDITPKAAYTIPGDTSYFAPVNVQLVC